MTSNPGSGSPNVSSDSNSDDSQSTLFAVRDAFEQGPPMAGEKTAFSLRDLDFDVGDLRSPLRTIDVDERETFRRRLDELGVL